MLSTTITYNLSLIFFYGIWGSPAILVSKRQSRREYALFYSMDERDIAWRRSQHWKAFWYFWIAPIALAVVALVQTIRIDKKWRFLKSIQKLFIVGIAFMYSYDYPSHGMKCICVFKLLFCYNSDSYTSEANLAHAATHSENSSLYQWNTLHLISHQSLK